MATQPGRPMRRGRGESPTSRRRMEGIERQRQAAAMRAKGHTFDEIATALGYGSPAAAHNAVTAALQRAVLPVAEEVRARELARLDALEDAIARRAAALEGAQLHEDPSGKTHVLGTQDSALDRLVKIQERRARLLGLDAPTKVDARTTFSEQDIDSIVADARAIVREVVGERYGAEAAAEIDAVVGQRILNGTTGGVRV